MLKPRFKVCFSTRALISLIISDGLEAGQGTSLVDQLAENAIAFCADIPH